MRKKCQTAKLKLLQPSFFKCLKCQI